MNEHILLQLALILAAAKIGGEVFERLFQQPAVLGEIVFGALVGHSVFGWVHGDSAVLGQIAEIGAVLLLFEIGLESNLEDLFGVGAQALWVACAGVAFPFALGYLAAHAMGLPSTESLFIGAVLTATSVGITARVFSDLGVLHMREARIVLGAAVADDVIGLIILAAMSGLAVTKTVSGLVLMRVTVVAVVFLVGSIVIGSWATPHILRLARKMQVRAALPAAAIIICLLTASLAETAQLAPIVGAFAAGLVLSRAEQRLRFESQVRALADIFVPVFFVMMGARMDLSAFNPLTAAGRAHVAIGAALVAVAIIGKIAGGLTVPGRGLRRWTIGIGMIPRGEVGLIFAGVGLKAGIVDAALYADAVFVVLCTTLVTPPLLKLALPQVVLRRGGGNPASIQAA